MTDVQLILPEKDADFSHIWLGAWLQPIGILTVATYAKQKTSAEIEVIDGSKITLLEISKKINAALVGISTVYGNYHNALYLAKVAKDQGAKVIFGGPYASALAQNILRNRKYVDGVVIEDGEEAFWKILSGEPFERIKNLVFRQNDKIVANPVENLALLPEVSYDFLNLESYFRSYQKMFPNSPFRKPLQHYAQKGCRWKERNGGCTFCGTPYKKAVRKEPKQFWEEIDRIVKKYGIDYFWESADTFGDDQAWLEELVLQKPSHLNPAFNINLRASQVGEHLIAILKHLNVYEVIFSSESASNDILINIRKGTTFYQNKMAVDLLISNGFQVATNFMLGARGETEATLEQTLEEIRMLREKCFVRQYIMSPIPGSADYERLLAIPEMREKYGREDMLNLWELRKDWNQYFCKVDFDKLVERALDEW